jgi:hypothetical protein
MASFNNADIKDNAVIAGQKAILDSENKQRALLDDVAGWDNSYAGLVTELDAMGRIDGAMPIDPEIISAREPLRFGKWFVWILRYPTFFPKPARAIARAILERSVTSVSGIPEPTIDKVEKQEGITKDTYYFPGARNSNSGIDLTLKVPERKGQPVRAFTDYWTGGFSDPETGPP